MERASNKARIKINLMMAVATLGACILMVYLGKKARSEGQSMSKTNEDWHRRINEEARLKEEAKVAASAK